MTDKSTIKKIELENQDKNPKVVHKPSKEEEKPINQTQKEGIVKTMPENKPRTKTIAINLIVSVLVVVAGVASGWGLSKVIGSSPEQTPEEQAVVNEEEIKVGDIYGKEINGFRDSAEGLLLKGGIEGEGSHRILRPGGQTQTVFLTSSVIDLDPFIDHKVTIWGETFAAQKANWLMDVGRVEVLELNAEKPFEEDLE
ncbi:hypothetical protein ACFL1M_02305 [Patescibacteria group bacterium]